MSLPDDVNGQPTSVGSMHSAAGAAEKDFFSPAEVDRLSPRDLDDPKLLNTVINSMKKWR